SSEEENFAADPAALKQSGKGFSGIETRVAEIATGINDLAVHSRNAGGDGDYGEAFEKKYQPSADGLREYMWALYEAIGALAGKTVGVAEVFEDTNSDATKNSRR